MSRSPPRWRPNPNCRARFAPSQALTTFLHFLPNRAFLIESWRVDGRFSYSPANLQIRCWNETNYQAALDFSSGRAAGSHIEAAVDSPHLAGDVRGGVGGEEVHDSTDFFGSPEASDRNLAGELVNHLLGDRRDHFCGDEAGGDGVDGQPDPVLMVFAGPGQQERGLFRQGLG